MDHIVIIGNGIAGVTAARHIRKLNSDYDITIISDETEHFYSRTALMYIFMGHMTYEHTKPYQDFFWAKNRISLIKNRVASVDFKQKVLTLANDKTISYSKLIIATGSTSNLLPIPGKDAKGVHTLYGMPDLELLEHSTGNTKNALIIGGGLIGMEMAEMLRYKKIPVTILIREDRYWGGILPAGEAQLVEMHMKEHHISLQKHTEVTEILTDDDGNVCGVKTMDNQEIAADLVGMTIGVHPNVSFLQGTGLDIDRGILVNNFLETNIPDVYAAGDCAQHLNPPPDRKPVEQIWYTGRIQGQVLAQTICDEKTPYNPGPFFNSAKFLDIEYQTYGQVPSETKEGYEYFFWQEGKTSLGIYMEKETRKLVGVNTLGIRLRHELIDSWLRNGAIADTIITHWRDLNFDQEFTKQYHVQIAAAYNARFGIGIKPKVKSWKYLLGLKAS